VIRTTSLIPLIANAQSYGPRTAVVDAQGVFTYNDLLDASSRVAASLLAGRDDLQEERVAFLVTPGFSWVAMQWGIWRAGGVAVPLPLNSTRPELEYLIDDTGTSALVFDTSAAPLLEPIAASRSLRAFSYDQFPICQPPPLPEISSERHAMILYTSGTTSKPKGLGMVSERPHPALFAAAPRARNHQRCWLCAVVGRYLRDASTLRRQCRVGSYRRRRTNSVHGGADGLHQAHRRLGCGFTRTPRGAKPSVLEASFDGLRLSGTAGEHAPTMAGNQWSHAARALRDDGDGTPVAPGSPGGIEVRGPAVFAEYWARPDATRDAFRDGWFITGDTAVVENGVYRILGRTNIDILKTGGHKVSALEIEEALRQHPSVAECGVVGIADAEWGERVAAAVVLKDGNVLDLQSLRTWARELLTTHKLPSRLLVLDALPRNAMGKVMKPALAALFQTTGTDPVA
jgi:malonyl-CoA/methylmalonyl-CoA synthetase